MLGFNKISLKEGRGKWEEARWDRMHLSVDESHKKPLEEATVKDDNWNGASNREWILRHLPKHTTNALSVARSS